MPFVKIPRLEDSKTPDSETRGVQAGQEVRQWERSKSSEWRLHLFADCYIFLQTQNWPAEPASPESYGDDGFSDASVKDCAKFGAGKCESG